MEIKNSKSKSRESRGHIDTSGSTTIQMRIAGAKVDLIIGRRRRTIQYLQKTSGTKMRFLHRIVFDECDKVLQIVGDADRVEQARQLILDLIDDTLPNSDKPAWITNNIPKFVTSDTENTDCNIDADYRKDRENGDIMKLTPLTKNFKCKTCYKSFKDKYALQRHSPTHILPKRSIKCPEGDCNSTYTNNECLNNHIETFHGRHIEIESLKFNSREEFKLWLAKMQKLESVKYVRKSSSSFSDIYYCHRSAQFPERSKAMGKRIRKKIGSIKSDRICTSRIKVHRQKTKDELHVKFIKTHSGHTIDPERVGLTGADKEMIANLIMQGIPKHRILEKMRTTEDVPRLRLIDRQDINNIARKYKIVDKLHNNEAESVEAQQLKILVRKKFSQSRRKKPEKRQTEFSANYQTLEDEYIPEQDNTETDVSHETTPQNYESNVTNIDENGAAGCTQMSHENYRSVLSYQEEAKSLCLPACELIDDEETSKILIEHMKSAIALINYQKANRLKPSVLPQVISTSTYSPKSTPLHSGNDYEIFLVDM